MPPGRKPKPVAEEAPMTDYEKLQARNIMRNNKMLQSLGVGTLSSLLNNPSKAKNTKRQPQHDKHKECLVDQVAEEVSSPMDSLTMNTLQSGGTRSKRVMAVEEEEDQSAVRVTRQRTKELRSEEAAQATSTNGQEDLLAVADWSTQPDDQIQPCNEGDQNAREERWIRGKSMGKDLDRICHGLCTKIPVHITEGLKRRQAPMQAAKLASESGIIVRNHIPILTHWKEYKKKENKEHFENYMGKVSAQFAIDTDNKAVVAACTDLMQSGLRQLRYKLKRDHFDGKPANQVPTTSPVASLSTEQWLALVDMWSSAKHKKRCMANKVNREKVQYQQRTGSRSYVAHGHVLLQQEKYKDMPPTPIDLFKEFHCSSKTGFSEPVKQAIAQMEAIVAEPVEEGQVPKTPAEAVAKVLPSTKFLQKIGQDPAATKRNTKSAARVQELEAEVEAGKQGAAALKGKVEDLEKKVADSEEAREKQLGEIEELRNLTEVLMKRQEKMDAVLHFFAGINKE